LARRAASAADPCRMSLTAPVDVNGEGGEEGWMRKEG
jgi:hypothetical protein